MIYRSLVMLLLSVPAMLAQAADIETDLAAVQTEWAVTQYETRDDQKDKAFENLVSHASQLVKKYPGQAEPLVWQGIVLSTYAGHKGGLGALGLAKEARQAFEASLKLDDTALGGSAHTSLGTLYSKVPGWPLGFGDDDKAEAHLRAGLNMNPEGIDANYFFAEFLKDQGQPKRALVYYQKAYQAPARPDRLLADRGRRHEIETRLEELGYSGPLTGQLQ